MKFETYKYIPKKQIINAALFSGICLFSAAALIISSVFIPNFQIIRIIYRLSAVVFATAGIQITTRFALSGYVYILEDTNFIVVRVNGAKSARVCSISLETVVGICEKFDETNNKNRKWREIEKQFGKIAVKRNLCQNIFAQKSYVSIVELNTKKTALVFETDKNFILEMQKRIEYAKTAAAGEKSNIYI